MAKYCIIGRDISYTLSPRIYETMWEGLGEEHTFEVRDIDTLQPFIDELRSGELLVKGFTVTSPYKEEIIPFLDHLTHEAEAVGAVNTVRVEEDGTLTGHNTDVDGFLLSLPQIPGEAKRALICGTGGASKAVQEGLRQAGIPFDVVSRTGKGLTYKRLSSLWDYSHIINATPLGSVKMRDKKPNLPYDTVSPGTVFFDLNYDPSVTPFMLEGLARYGIALDGLRMLIEMITGPQWRFLSKQVVRD